MKKPKLSMSKNGKPQVDKEPTPIEALSRGIADAINHASDYQCNEYSIVGVITMYVTSTLAGRTGCPAGLTEQEILLMTTLRKLHENAVEAGMPAHDVIGIVMGTLFGAMFAFRATRLFQQQQQALGIMQEQPGEG